MKYDHGTFRRPTSGALPIFGHGVGIKTLLAPPRGQPMVMPHLSRR
jgi:hypothetical protein